MSERGYRPDPPIGIVEEVVGETVGGTEQLAIDVKLTLAPGAVADTHRHGVSPALQVTEFSLGQVPFTADAEHDLQVAAPLEGARPPRPSYSRRTRWPRPDRPPPTGPRS